MTPDVLLGLTLGGGLGAANAAASYGLFRLVRDRPDTTFYRVVFLGMLARMGAGLALVALVFALVPAHFLVFTLALLAATVAGLVVETALVCRRPARPPHALREPLPHPTSP